MSGQAPFEFYFGHGAKGGYGTDGYSYGYVLARTTTAAPYGYKFDGYLCDSGQQNGEYLDLIAIASICASQGFHNSSAIQYYFQGEGNHKKPYVLGKMWCNSTTTQPALNCSYSYPVGFANCSVNSCLWVTCTGEGLDSIGIQTNPVLTDGNNDLQFMVTDNQQGYLYTPAGWVCHDNFGEEEAKVVCFEMGLGLNSYNTSHTIPNNSDTGVFGFGPNVVSMGLDELECSPNPSGISSCYYTYNHNCDHYEGVYLDCTGPYVDLRQKPRSHSLDWMVATVIVTFLCSFFCILALYLSWRVLKCSRRLADQSRDSGTKISIEISNAPENSIIFDPEHQPGYPYLPRRLNDRKSYLEPKFRPSGRTSRIGNQFKLSASGRGSRTQDSLEEYETPPSPGQNTHTRRITTPGELGYLSGSYDESQLTECTARTKRPRGTSLDSREGEPTVSFKYVS